MAESTDKRDIIHAFLWIFACNSGETELLFVQNVSFFVGVILTFCANFEIM